MILSHLPLLFLVQCLVDAKGQQASLLGQTAGKHKSRKRSKIIIFFLNEIIFNAGYKKIIDNSTNDCLPSCPVGWEPFDGRCYFWVTNQVKNWSDAENFCQTKGGHLVSVTRKEINDYLMSRLGHCGQHRVWIGATYQKKEGSWEWPDSSSPVKEDWTPVRPSLQNTENCAELYNIDEQQQGQNDFDCEASLNFVCSKTLCEGTVLLQFW